ncbi:hypothetical protein [Micromonospora sp. WMMD1082]|uniref:hypothetical protein n=1 Tax=Micromonospora sp. WMMD1082 TaxID=3016104 RepID=UPI0024169625|nr:hypothetical protein [Micromonospora sp. WMMD1082]MDG4792683.1 hypothetical protein [Micromonospora sp. WMMD1082]
MTQIFEHVDPCADRMTVETGGEDDLIVRNSTAAHVGVILAPADVDRLRDALKPYGTRRDSDAPAEVVEVGEEYRLLPGARYTLQSGTHASTAVEDGVTRVRVKRRWGSDGDWEVEGLDGARSERAYIVQPKYLAPLDELTQGTPPLAPGDRARVTGDTASWGHGFKAGDVVTLVGRGDNYGSHQGNPRGWLCQHADGVTDWYVHADDLAPLGSLATDEAVEALRERLGVAPTFTVHDEAHAFFGTTTAGQLDPARVAAVREAMAILGDDGASVDLEALLAVAEFLIGDA